MESKQSCVRVDLFIKFEYYVGLKVYLILNLTPILDSKQFFINLQVKINTITITITMFTLNKQDTSHSALFIFLLVLLLL